MMTLPGDSPINQMRDILPLLTSLTPLTGPNGQRFIYTLGQFHDLLIEKAFQASTIRVPGAGDPSQLPYLAQDRAIFQGPQETNAQFVTRLQQAFPIWKNAGSRASVLGQVQAYLANQQPGVMAGLPECLIVGGVNAAFPNSASTWDSVYIGQSQGVAPSHRIVSPANWNWDGKSEPWRAWIVMFMAPVSTGISGTAANIASAAGTCYLGHTVNGAWVPQTSGTPVNEPWITISGMTGVTSANVGQWVQFSGCATTANNVFAQIGNVTSPGTIAIANPKGVAPDANNGSIHWALSEYPYIGPGPCWGAANAPAWSAGVAIPQQQNTTPGLPTPFNGQIGQTSGGAWIPATTTLPLSATTSQGLTCSTYVIQSIRQLIQRWKSAGTFYPHIIVSFGGGDSSAGYEFSPNSAQGSGNPNGTWGGPGKNVNGVWVPAKVPVSPFTCFCDGSAIYSNCSVYNVN